MRRSVLSQSGAAPPFYIPTKVHLARNAAEAYLGDDFTYKLTAVTAMYHNLKFFSKVNDPGRLYASVGARLAARQVIGLPPLKQSYACF